MVKKITLDAKKLPRVYFPANPWNPVTRYPILDEDCERVEICGRSNDYTYLPPTIKSLHIKGDTGKHLGGYIGTPDGRLNGKDSTYVPMSRGVICVEGDAEEFAAHKMSGGKIIVKGYVGKDSGHKMIGGKLSVGQVNGDFCEGMRGGCAYAESVKGDLGNSMYAGVLVVEKNVAGSVAKIMRDGIIVVKGSVKGTIGAFPDLCECVHETKVENPVVYVGKDIGTYNIEYGTAVKVLPVSEISQEHLKLLTSLGIMI